MIKNFVTVSFTTIVIAVMLLIYHSSTPNPVQASKSVSLSQANTNTAAAQTQTPKYIIKVLDGCLAVYVPSSSQPVQLTNIDMRTLRTNDQKIIAQGVPIYSDQQLTEFLEDFGS